MSTHRWHGALKRQPAIGIARHYTSFSYPPGQGNAGLGWNGLAQPAQQGLLQDHPADLMSTEGPTLGRHTCGSGRARWKRFFKPCTAVTRFLKQGQPLPAGT